MGLSRVSYNGYTFPDRSNFSVREEFVYDDSRRTVAYTRFVLRVETIIVTDHVPSDGNFEDPALYVGSQMHVLRQRLSKVGCELKIEHDGFGPRPHLSVGGAAGNPIRDVNFGPKPRMLAWNPVGHTTCAEVVWECEFSIPICDGVSGVPQFEGLSSYNYSIAYDIDHRGFTTRRIQGSIEIALSRSGREIVDTVDRYRNVLIVAKPDNFRRSVHWNVSTDKRRADFLIVDAEISSQNVWPDGVVNIAANHRVGWSRPDKKNLSNVIHATIELAANQPLFRAWEIFRALFRSRMSAIGEENVFMESLDVSEELFENRISFAINYRVPLQDLSHFFAASGLLQPIENAYAGNLRDWASWSQSVRTLEPFQGSGNDRGLAQLSHRFYEDRIIDLCDTNLGMVGPEPATRSNPLPTPVGVFCNQRPLPLRSWLQFESSLRLEGGSKGSASVTLGPDPYAYKDFDPADIDGSLDDEQQNDIRTFIESNAGLACVVWEGRAERYGYPIQKPGILKLGGARLKPIGTMDFEQKFMGIQFCQPVYQAMWRIRYMLTKVPSTMRPEDADKVNDPQA